MRLMLLAVSLCACHSDTTLVSTGLEGDLSLEGVSVRWSGEDGEALGQHLGAADLDGDGARELVTAGAGRVVHVIGDPLRAGASDGPEAALTLDDELERLRGVGDLDGDGADEVAVALNGQGDEAEEEGREGEGYGQGSEEERGHYRTDNHVNSRVIALLGQEPDGALSEHAWIEDPHRHELEVEGVVEYHVEGPGDVDGDGYGDLWLAQHDSGEDARGRAWLLLGPLVDRVELSESALVVEGGLPWFHLGGEPGGAADWSGDGRVDLAIGSASRSAGLDSALYLIDAEQRGLDLAEDTAFAVLFGDDSTSSVSALPGVGDLDGDGHPDLALRVVHSDASYVRVAWGPVQGPIALESLSDGLYAEGWDSMPAAVIAGDIDGDGRADLSVGAPAPWDDPGRVSLAYGPVEGLQSVTAAEATLHGASNGDRVGSTLAPLGDADGDGLADLLIGAPGADRAGVEAGAVYALGGQRR